MRNFREGQREGKGGGPRVTSLMTAHPHRRHPGLFHFLSVSPQGWLRPLPILIIIPTPFPSTPNKKSFEKSLNSTCQVGVSLWVNERLMPARTERKHWGNHDPHLSFTPLTLHHPDPACDLHVLWPEKPPEAISAWKVCLPQPTPQGPQCILQLLASHRLPQEAFSN